MTRLSRLGFMAITFITLLCVGCDSDTRSPALPTVSMKLGSANFLIEIANTDPNREHGLMQRDSMPGNHGMIFVFPDEKPREFWMKNTRFPLDIAYIDHTGQIVSIRQMKSYDLTSVPSNAPAKYAIELNLGVAAQAGLKVGDHVDVPVEARETKE